MFVVIQETGNYTSVNYTPVGVFTTIEDAIKYQTIREYEADILEKIATILMERKSFPRFEVFEVPENPLDSHTSVEMELAELDKKYKNELQSATEWREAHDQKKKNAEIQHKKIEMERQRMEVYAFIDYWNAGTIENEKKIARFREIKKDMQPYLLNTGDEKVITWLRQNNLSMSL